MLWTEPTATNDNWIVYLHHPKLVASGILLLARDKQIDHDKWNLYAQ
jgi:hypothetical protein